MDKTQILKDKIQDADFALIGIGEEFNEKFEEIEKYPELVKALNAIDSNDKFIEGLNKFAKGLIKRKF